MKEPIVKSEFYGSEEQSCNNRKWNDRNPRADEVLVIKCKISEKKTKVGPNPKTSRKERHQSWILMNYILSLHSQWLINGSD